jgi:peptide methionine sulfoxide reductase MsrA
MLTGVKHDGKLMIGTGCFWGTPEEFEARVKETHADNEYARRYMLAMTFLREWAGGAK